MNPDLDTGDRKELAMDSASAPPIKKFPLIFQQYCDRIRNDVTAGKHRFSNAVQYGAIEPNLVATGRAKCRCCGQKIKKGDLEHRFYWDFNGCGSWTAVECHIHAAACKVDGKAR